MSVQTSVASNQAIGLAGGIADTRLRDSFTALAEGGDIGFGVVVSRGTSADQAVIGGASPVGVTLRSIDRAANADGSIAFLAGEAMAVCATGTVLVEVAGGSDAISAGDAVKFSASTGLMGSVGTALPNAVFMADAVAGEIAAIRIN